VTPFLPDGVLDLRSFEANLEAYAAFDLGGALVLGSNGETPYLDEAERLSLVRTARRASPRTLLAGAGHESTRQTIDFVRKVADEGVDAALVLTPHYYRGQMTPEALRRHYEAVAEASPIPVLLYSVPVFTGLPIPPAVALAVAGHPRIAGMKDSGGDVAALSRVAAEAPPSFALACGSAPVFYAALCVGAVAGVLAVACCAPRPTVALHRAFVEGDHARARRLQEALTPLAVAVTGTHGVAGLKLAMDLAGFRGGAVRAPLLPAPPSARAEIASLLARAEAAAG
jgi:4-hydroxy-2-oxoglutarate aldolase